MAKVDMLAATSRQAEEVKGFSLPASRRAVYSNAEVSRARHVGWNDGSRLPLPSGQPSLQLAADMRSMQQAARSRTFKKEPSVRDLYR